MPISDIPILSMLHKRLEWHQERQRILAENVANSDTPNYQAMDLAPLNFDRELSAASVTLARTDAGHMVADGAEDARFAADARGRFEVRPRGNTVTHEDEMMKVASNQMDFEAAASLYTHSLALIKVAIDK
jgi:flagellar basal-body rod protein FlgB